MNCARFVSRIEEAIDLRLIHLANFEYLRVFHRIHAQFAIYLRSQKSVALAKYRPNASPFAARSASDSCLQQCSLPVKLPANSSEKARTSSATVRLITRVNRV